MIKHLSQTGIVYHRLDSDIHIGSVAVDGAFVAAGFCSY